MRDDTRREHNCEPTASGVIEVDLPPEPVGEPQCGQAAYETSPHYSDSLGVFSRYSHDYQKWGSSWEACGRKESWLHAHFIRLGAPINIRGGEGAW